MYVLSGTSGSLKSFLCVHLDLQTHVCVLVFKFTLITLVRLVLLRLLPV